MLLSVLTPSCLLAVQIDAPSTFRAEVKEVRVDIQVLDGKRIVTGLTAADFLIRDEGEPQPLTRFGEDSEPLSLLLLIDVSGSMKKFARQMATSAKNALPLLGPQDQVAVMLFSKETELISPFNSRFTETAREIDVGVEQAALPLGTAIYASVRTAANVMAGQGQKFPQHRRAILILTDNASLNYQVSERDVLQSLYATSTVLNALVTESAERPRPRRSGEYRNPDFTPTDIFRIAEQTGGEALRAERADRAFPDLLARLRSRYSLSYRAPAAIPGDFRRIQIELTGAARKRYPDAIIRARAGYYVDP